MGAAWGPHCEICPSPTLDDYQDLCLESGYSVDGHGKRFCNIFDTVSLEANWISEYSKFTKLQLKTNDLP